MDILLRNRFNNKVEELTGYHRRCNRAAYKVIWDYNGWRKASRLFSQKDWNQTLVSKINEVSTQIHKATLRGGANEIVISPKLLPLFKDLEYYNANEEMMGGRYKVIIDEEMVSDRILIGYNNPNDKYQAVETTFMNSSTFSHSRYDEDGNNNQRYGVIRIDNFGGDAEQEFLGMMSEQICKGIDAEIIKGLITKPNRRYLLINKK